jgi:hypothetical protein
MAKFKYWLENIFWYHFKWYWLFGVAAAAFVVMIIAGNVRTANYDWNVAFIRGNSAYFSSRAYVNDELPGYFESILPDTDGNRRVRVNVTYISTVGFGLEFDVGSMRAKSGAENAFFALANPDCYVALMDKESFERWSDLGYVADSRYSKRLAQYVAVIDPPVVFTDVDSAKTIGMSDSQIADNDALIQETHDALLRLALEALERVE